MEGMELSRKGDKIPVDRRGKKIQAWETEFTTKQFQHTLDDQSSNNSEQSEEYDLGRHARCFQRNVVKKKNNSVHLFRMLFLPCIPIVALIFQDCVTLYNVTDSKTDLYDSMNQVKLTVKYGKLLAALQAERSEIAYSVFNNGSVFKKNLTERFVKTDEALGSLDKWPKFKVLFNAKLFNSRLRFRIGLEDYRKQLMTFIGDVESTDVAIISVVKWYNYANQGLLDQLDMIIEENSGSDVWRLMIAYKNLLRCLENLGISLVYGLVYYGRGVLSDSTFVEYVKYTALAEGYLNASSNFAQFAKGSFGNVTGNYEGYEELRKSRQQIMDNEPINASVDKADAYYNSMELYQERLRSILINLRNIIIEEIEAIEISADQQIKVAVIVLVVVITVAPILVLIMYRLTSTTQMFAQQLIYNSQQYKKEKKRADALLCQLLPLKTAHSLKSLGKVTAEVYESVTIYISDIVSFTSFCSDSTPGEAIGMLNSLYKLFDLRLQNYDVYKVESIGDAYMVVSGLPERNGSRHAAEIAIMALDVMHNVQEFRIPHRTDKRLQIRVGIHSGTCIAGVVGTKMPRYCLFGDSVIVANQLEAESEAMRILVSHVTKAYLDETESNFITEQRSSKVRAVPTSYWLLGCAEHDLALSSVGTGEKDFLWEAAPEILDEIIQ